MWVKKIGFYINHSQSEIQKYLKLFKDIVNKDNFFIPTTQKRLKNKNFIEKYSINVKKQKEMLLTIDVLDFCYSIDNDGETNERLYIFAKDFELNYWGIKENILVYIKIVIKKEDYTVIVSFHEAERNIKKLFI